MLRKFINNNFPLTKIKIGIAKILYFFVSIVYGKKPRIITRNNITYEVDLSEGIDLSLFLFGKFQKHVTNSELLKISKDATIIDVGANFGLMSLPLPNWHLKERFILLNLRIMLWQKSNGIFRLIRNWLKILKL